MTAIFLEDGHGKRTGGPHQGKQADFACAKSDNDCDDGDDDKTDF